MGFKRDTTVNRISYMSLKPYIREAPFSFTPENRSSLLPKGAYALSIVLALVAGRARGVRALTVVCHQLGSGERERRQPGYRGRDTWSSFRGQSQGQDQH